MLIVKGESGEEDKVLDDILKNISKVVRRSVEEFEANEEVRTNFAAEVEKEKANRAGASKQASKEERRKKMQQQYSCKKAVYENCRIFGPDGQHLCNCNTKKAMWYVHKGLGAIVSNGTKEDSENLQVKLNFIPNSNKLSLDPSHELYNEEFHIYDRNNNCVVCSSAVNFSRCQIIPALYRSRFPHSMKSHSNHDIVLLCFPCQEKA